MTFTFSYETVALIMFASMGLLMLTGQRVFGAIGFVGAVAGPSFGGRAARRWPSMPACP